MMGAGKSTVGRALARRLGRPFVDTDEEIARARGASIPEIFEREGEAAFREHERAAIEAAAERAGVVALGGGAVCQPGAPERLRARGQLVYLRARPESLAERLGAGRGRPLLAGAGEGGLRARLEALLAERKGAYEAADWTVDVDGRSVDEVVELVLAGLEGRGARP